MQPFIVFGCWATTKAKTLGEWQGPTNVGTHQLRSVTRRATARACGRLIAFDALKFVHVEVFKPDELPANYPTISFDVRTASYRSVLEILKSIWLWKS